MKIDSKGKLLNMVESILSWNPKYSINEETKLYKTETPDFKEGLVVYFSQIDAPSFERAKNKLNSTDTSFKIKPPLPDPKNPELYDGDEGRSFDIIKTAVKHLNEDQLSSKDKEFYFNAFSIAERIRKNFRGPVQVDRGKAYSKIRKHAISLIQSEYQIRTTEDKWCPADIYIYNSPDAPTKALSAKSINQGKDSLNALFKTTDKKSGSGILGISLKEEKAQAGKAGSFKNVLTKEQNYPDAPGLPEILENVMVLFYNMRVARETGYPTKTSKDTLNLQTKIDSIKYLVKSYNAVSKLVSLGMNKGNMKKIQTSLLEVLQTEVGSSILKSSVSDKGFDAKKVKEAMEAKYLKKYDDLKSIPVKSHVLDRKYTDPSKDLIKLSTSVAKSVNDELVKQYEKEKEAFLGVLKKQGFSNPSTKGKALTTSKIGLEIETAETLLKKARCYSIAQWMMEGLNTDSLKIPPVYKTIMKQKNAFVALTAFAIGMAGVSPTFFKYVGNRSGGSPAVEPFWGNGFLNLEGDASEVEIVDGPSNKGFYVSFETNVTLEDAPGSDIVGKYKVTLDFRYAGDQINIEVQELKGEY